MDKIDKDLLTILSYSSRGLLPPLAAAVGGFVAQEVLKALTGKFTPLKQWVGELECQKIKDFRQKICDCLSRCSSVSKNFSGAWVMSSPTIFVTAIFLLYLLLVFWLSEKDIYSPKILCNVLFTVVFGCH